jgi:hypothetical protein
MFGPNAFLWRRAHGTCGPARVAQNGLLDIIKYQIVSLNFGPHVRTATASHNKSVKPHEHSTAIARNVGWTTSDDAADAKQCLQDDG